MEIKEVQKQVDEFIKKGSGGEYWAPLSMFTRLAEEVGELARAMNIKHGDKKSKFEGDGRDVEKELVDVLFTLLAIANKEEVDLDKEFCEKLKLDYEKCKGVYRNDNFNT